MNIVLTYFPNNIETWRDILRYLSPTGTHSQLASRHTAHGTHSQQYTQYTLHFKETRHSSSSAHTNILTAEQAVCVMVSAAISSRQCGQWGDNAEGGGATDQGPWTGVNCDAPPTPTLPVSHVRLYPPTEPDWHEGPQRVTLIDGPLEA